MITTGPRPAGFGDCGTCAYRAVGPRRLCQSCAAATLEHAEPECPVCGQQLRSPRALCGNYLCRQPAVRHFHRSTSIALKTGPLDASIRRHKYEGKSGWALIFARVLLGQLEQNPPDADLIIPMPASPSSPYDHAKAVVRAAIDQDDIGFPLRADPPVIIRRSAADRMAGARFADRRRISDEIYASLVLPDPSAVIAKNIAVFDDVFTTGHTLNAVARKLREEGAAQVTGIMLARQPWSGP